MPGLILCSSPRSEHPFSRSYGVILPSSLTVDHSRASVYSTRPPVSVYSTGGSLAFLGGGVACSLRPGARLGGASPSHLARPISASLSSTAGGGILTSFPSDSPERVLLRARLTLIRRTLIRNPWSFGVGDLHPHCRYLCLHLLFQPLHRGSRLRLRGCWNAPLPVSADH